MPYFTHELDNEKFETLRHLVLKFIYATVKIPVLGLFDPLEY